MSLLNLVALALVGVVLVATVVATVWMERHWRDLAVDER